MGARYLIVQESALVEYYRIQQHVVLLEPRDRVDDLGVHEEDVALMHGEPFVVDADGAGAFLHLHDLHLLVPMRGDGGEFVADQRRILRERAQCRAVHLVLVKVVKLLFCQFRKFTFHCPPPFDAARGPRVCHM